MRGVAPLVAALALHGPTAAWAEPARAVAVPSATTVTVGEPFTVEVRGEAPASARWGFPPEVVTPEVTLEKLETSPRPNVAVYRATVFGLDEVTIPAVTATFEEPDGTRGQVATAPLAIKVSSLLPDDPEEQRLADLRPPVGLPAGAPFWIALGLLLAGLVSAAVWWWRRRRRAAGVTEPTPVPEVPPGEEALGALGRLEAAGLLERGELRAFYIELVAIAKRYLERRLEAPVLEMTSAETFAFLRDHPLAGGLAGRVRELTAAADEVKFAGGPGEQARARRHLEQVRGVVDELERLLAAATAVGEGEAA
ncbi:MAG: hypothetical protein HRF46_16105 [Acidobacteriota bacterium]|mgnify:CR=1 FL=1|jgi:hypothetical protein